MIDFKYCIWFIPNKNHEWNNIINDFDPHMTIKSKLHYKDAINEYSKISCDRKIKIKLIDNIKQDIDDENKFYALLYNIKIDDDTIKPIWWPENAHISFAYRYDIKFNKSEIDKIKEKIKIKDGILEKIILQKCTGHYKNWGKN
jgi:hypothetical protein